jgi:hypothetical protein
MVTKFNVDFDEHGVGLYHHMPESDGVYMKEIHLPAGKELFNHKHTFTHKSILAKGEAIVRVEGGEDQRVTGPVVLTITKGLQHSVVAITDVTWFCIHASDESDPEKIDHTLVEEN